MGAADLREAVAQYLANGGRIQTLKGFIEPSPLRERRALVDTETKLRRNDRYIRPMHSQMLSTPERKRLRAMAEQL